MTLRVGPEPGLCEGTHFVFAKDTSASAKLAEHVRREGSRTLPLWQRTYDLEWREIGGPRLDDVPVSCVTTDKDLYREADDVVHVLVIDPARADEEVPLEVFLSGQPYRRFTARLDYNGMGTFFLHQLVPGAYDVVGPAGQTRFEVAGYSVGALTGGARETVLAGGRLTTTLDLSALGQAISGRVRVTILESERPVHGPVTLVARDGSVLVEFAAQGDGPFSAHVCGVDDPLLDAVIPLRGTAKHERSLTTVARLGREWVASALKLEGGRCVRGLWLRADGTNNAPLVLEDPVAQVGRLVARAPLADLVLTLVQPGRGRVVHRHLPRVEPGQVIEFGVQAPFTLALVGGFAEGEPFERGGCVTPLAELGLALEVPRRAEPRGELEVTLRTARAGRVASVYVVVRDARLKPADHPLTRMATRLKNAMGALLGGPNEESVGAKDEMPHVRRMPVRIRAPGNRFGASGDDLDALGGDLGSMGSDFLELELGGAGDDDLMPGDAPGLGGLARMASMSGVARAGEPLVAGSPAPRGAQPRDRFRDVVFAGLVHVRGEERLRVPLGDALGELEVDAFALAGGDWAGATAPVEVLRETFGELTLPALVHAEDAAAGRLEAGWAQAPVRVELTCDGRRVPLTCASGTFDPAAESGPGRATLTFPATPGRWECVVRDGSGREDRSVREVTSPGTFRALTRTVRVLMPGESLSAEAEGALFLRVLPGVDTTLHEVSKVTAGFAHHCCEQTAAKLLAAVAGLMLARAEAERDRLEGVVQDGTARLESMWVKGRGLRLYPEQEGVSSYGATAVRHLLSLRVLAGAAGLSPNLRDALGRMDAIATDGAKAYALPPGASSLDVSGDGAVARRVGRCREVVALLRQDSPAAIRQALRHVDEIGRERSAHGAWYSTTDSAAAILMFHELSQRRLIGTGGVDAGRETREVKAGAHPLLVESAAVLTEDWTTYKSKLPVAVRLRRDEPARATLEIDIPYYADGDLAHVCLPPALARAYGGGRVQSFTVDFEGKTHVSIPLVASGDPRGQHYFTCVRNMFEEERIGNPGVMRC